MTAELERISRIVNEVGRLDGIDDLRLSREGTATLSYQSGRTIYFEYIEANERLFLYSPLMRIPPDEPRRLVLFEAMLHSNFLKLATGHGELSISRNMQQVMYQYSLETVSLDISRLNHAIDNVLSRCETIPYQLERKSHEEPSPIAKSTKSIGAGTFHRLVGSRGSRR